MGVACPYYGDFGHVHGGPSYDRKPCQCGAAFRSAVQCPGCGANQTGRNGECLWCGAVYRPAIIATKEITK